MKTLATTLLIALFFFSCEKPNDPEECLTVCEECDSGWPEMEEDIMPPVEAPTRANPKVIVILYHNLVYGRTGSIYNRDIYNFEHDLKYIRNNFKVIDFDDLDKINTGEMTLTQDAAIITFDDGDLSIYPIAFPLLKKYDLKATFFIVSSYVGEVGYASWNQLREIVSYTSPYSSKLFSIGSHTATHASLGDLTLGEAEMELFISKQSIESELDIDVKYVALPYGSGADNPDIQSKAQELGYKGLRNSNPTSISNFPINMYNIPCLNIENYSNDKFIANINGLLGR